MRYFIIVAAFMMVLSGSAIAQDTGFGDWDAPFESATADYDATDYWSGGTSDYSGNSCGMSYSNSYTGGSFWSDWYTL